MEVLRLDHWTNETTKRLRDFEKSLIIALKVKNLNIFTEILLIDLVSRSKGKRMGWKRI